MQIKRFEAKDMTTALRLIKKDLGADAVILSARSLKKENKITGRVKSTGVEVTAAVDGYPLADAMSPALVAGAVSSYRRNETITRPSRQNFRQSVGSRIKSIYDRQRPSQLTKRRQFSNDDLLSGVFQHLLSQEVKRDIANDIIDRLAFNSPDHRFETRDQIIEGISGILEQKRKRIRSRLRTLSGCRVMAIIGPTGVGKTTTLAKLVARHAIEEGKNVALISLDSDRVGGITDLEVYAKAMSVPVVAVGTQSAFKATVNEFRRFDRILVDTSGFNARNPDQIEDLKACLKGIDAVEIHLALSAMAKESDLLNALRCLNTFDVQHLIFTKLDESCTCGNLINVLMQHPLPLSFVTCGRDVPHNIETGSIDKIVERLLVDFDLHGATPNSGRAGRVPLETAAPEDGSDFVANKNSDVFHRRNCKWTQKIKSKNMITFSSAQAAKLANFMPCQDCHPARSSRFQAGLPVGNNMRISNYS
jgi:flagellar biosynthesis protein FlhF